MESQQNKKNNTSTNPRYSGRFTGTDTGKKVASSTTTYNPNSSKGGTSANKRCYKCQGLGYFANDCPNKQIVTLVEEDVGPVFNEYDDDCEKVMSDSEEITYADSGEVLVVRRTMSAVLK